MEKVILDIIKDIKLLSWFIDNHSIKLEINSTLEDEMSRVLKDKNRQNL